MNEPIPLKPEAAIAVEPVVVTETEVVVATPVETESRDDDGAPVVFTPEDVHARPPDRPPTENAPASEKAGLIFERS